MAALSLVAFVLHALFTRRFRRLVHPWLWAGFALGAAIAAPWFIAIARQAPGFFDHYVGREMADRISGRGYFSDAEYEIGKHLTKLLVHQLPWSLLALAGAGYAIARVRKGDRAYPLFLLLWILCIGIPTYSVKRMTFKYNIPLFPGFAGLCAMALWAWFPPGWKARVPRALYVVAVAALVVVIVLPVPERERRYDPLKRMGPVLRAHVPANKKVVGYKLRHRDAIRFPRLAVFYYCDRELSEVDDPAVVARRDPAALLAESEHFETEIAPLGYFALLRDKKFVLAVRPPRRAPEQKPGEEEKTWKAE
jgi:hypothetical protein